MRLLRRGDGLEAERPARLQGARRPFTLPAIRSGTSLELVEASFWATGVSREAALTLDPVSACRNLIVGTLVQLQPFRFRGDERLDGGWLLTQPDPSTTWVATLAGTVDDLLFFGRAYWRVLERDPDGYPRRARWTPFRDVTPNVRSTGGSYATLVDYTIAGVEGRVPVDDVIRFDGAIPSILETGAQVFAQGLALEAAATRFASTELPAGVITNEGSELGPDEAQTFLENFAANRSKYGLAFLQNASYERADLNPGDLQLLEARHNVATQVARLFGVGVAMIGASPSGHSSALLYSNLTQQNSLLLSTACAPHIYAIESTLTAFATPTGQAVAFDVQQFLRSDPQAAADYVIALEGAGIVDRTEARAMLGIPTTSGAGEAAPDLAPGGV
jgi:HK97 family phage portal protein